jgi:hypothetical protein
MKDARQGRQHRAVGRLTAATLAAVVALAVGSWPVAAQEGTATLRGIVFDSTTMSALSGARVAVMGTTATGMSDEDGRFEVGSVPAGEYWVSFYHPRLQTLGVGAPSQQVSFSEGGTSEVELTVPSESTLLLGWCLAEQHGPGYAAIAGVVTDSLTGVPMSRAIVTVVPERRRAGDPAPPEVRADESGYYRICDAPAGREVKVQAHFGQSSGRSVQTTLTPGSATIRDLVLLVSAEGILQGRVVDYVSGQPVPGAAVSVLGTTSRVLTDAEGVFLMDELPPGRHLVVTEHLAYESRTDSVTIFSQETVGIEVRMATEALEVEGLVVTARMRFGENTLNVGKRQDIMTRDEIEPLLGRVQSAGDLLRNMNVPGFSVREVYIDDPITGVRMPGLCVEVSRRSGGQGCRPASVFVNGVYIPQPDQFLRNLDPNVVDRIEVLSPIDAQFQFGTLAGNGAVVIYTR